MMFDESITVKPSSQYGNERFFPKDESATLFCKLAKQKSLTLNDLKIIESLGYKVNKQH